MYVTRPLSMYQRDPSALSLPPPEGPSTGILVIQDEEAEPTCFGLCKDNRLRDLPFPQNKNLKVEYTTMYTTQAGMHQHVETTRAHFIPVLNQPLSSNQYYVIKGHGKHKGEGYISSKEEDMQTCCFCNCISDLQPRSLDPKDINQQFEIQRRRSGSFVAKSVAPDGFPPAFLRRKGWRAYTSTPLEFKLSEAPGLDTSLRACLPNLNFPLSQKNSTPVVVGKWYCPFMFIKERTLKDQIDSSVYYEIILEQRWEQIFACENSSKEGNAVTVDVTLESEVIAVGGREGVHNEKNVVDGVMWLRSSSNAGGERNVGLSLVVVERMKWEQERFGWADGSERPVNVKRVEEYGGMGEWRKFGCYVFVERFVLKRMNGSLVLTYDFRHSHQIRSKWE